MAHYKAVTHEDIKQMVKQLPVVWKSELGDFGLYYRTQKTAMFKEQLILVKRTRASQNEYIKALPLALNSFYHPQTGKRIAIAKIDELVYPIANRIVQRLNQQMEGVEEPKNEDELLKLTDLQINSLINPFIWVDHDKESASVIFPMGNRFPGVPKKYLRNGHALADYIEYMMCNSKKITGILNVSFDPESGMFAMYTSKGYFYDLYRYAKAFVDEMAEQASK